MYRRNRLICKKPRNCRGRKEYLMEIEQKYIDSREVAEMVGKDHKELLRDIRRYCEQLGKSKIALSDFFLESTYQSSQNKTMPCFQVTKKGCEFIAHKLTGQRGAEFTAKYINRFHDMEKQIKQPKSPIQLLEMEFAALKEVDSKVDAVNKDLQEFKLNLPLLPADADEVKNEVNRKAVSCLGGKNSNAYRDKSLRSKVYTDIYRELKRQFDVSRYKYIRRNQKEIALEIVKGYNMPLILAEQVRDCNAQINLEDDTDGV